MLSRSLLLDAPEMQVAQVSCDGHDRGWSPAEEVGGIGLVLVRRGVFRRRADGTEAVLDPTVAYVQRPGEIQQMAHPAGGDVCTSIRVRPATGERLPRSGPIRVAPAVDLAHRRLVAGALRGADGVALADLATDVVAALVDESVTRPRTCLADDARALLAAEPALRLTDLAARLAVSPWYLSRLFHRVTGVTIGRFRMRVRARAALDRFVEGDRRVCLASLAVELGFADQAHLTRVLRAETGRPPAALRRLLDTPR